MGRSGNIGWGISSYFGLPNRKRNLLTREFLQTFKEEIITIDSEDNKNQNEPEINYEEETYDSFYEAIRGTGLFYKALRSACEKHNLIKAIYKYVMEMPWYDSDCFEDDLVLEMIEKDVIKRGSPENYIGNIESDEKLIKYKLIQYHKGYNIVKYGDWCDTDRETLENIYKDRNWELIWLD